MFSHSTLRTNAGNTAKPVWDAVATERVLPLFIDHPLTVTYAEPTGPKTLSGPAFNGKPATFGNDKHVTFLAKSCAVVDPFHKTVLDNGGRDEGLPGPRPHCHPNRYGTYVRDPHGNKLQAVCHSSKG